MIFFIFIYILKVESLGRVAQTDGNDVVGTLQHIDFQTPNRFCILLGGNFTSQNESILAFMAGKLGTHPLQMPSPRPGSWRLMDRLYLDEAQKFDWPDMEAPPQDTHFCLGLREQVAVLVDGTVVPCCLDHEGDIPLGHLPEEDLEDILESPRARAIYDGFTKGQPAEELCRRCGFATRFG